MYFFVTYKAGSSILAGFGGTFVNVPIAVGPSVARVADTNVATVCVLWDERGDGGGREGGREERGREGGRREGGREGGEREGMYE